MNNKLNNPNLRRVACIEPGCGAIRWVRTNNVGVVKRCIIHQYERKKDYNSQYVRRSRQLKRTK